MDTLIKLQDIAVNMHLEPTEEVQTSPAVAPCGQALQRERQPQKELGIFHAAAGGRTVPILKTMLTTACERNCFYCPFRAGRNSYRRTTVKPEEMAKVTADMARAGLIRGLFLSSGIIGGGVKTQDRLIKTVEILRQQYGFRGYIHLKIMPGAEQAQVERAAQLADRLSINLEAPNDRRLHLLAPMKQFSDELVRPLQWVQQLRASQTPAHTWNGKWPSTVTQFVVGAVGESDVEILSTSEHLYRHERLTRTYFSAFSPIEDTPLEDVAAAPPLREHRLYQASFLFRDYGFTLEEMPFDDSGYLPLDEDPKLAWAKLNLFETPVEINQASRDELLRVPGIGPKSAHAILSARRKGTLRDLRDLQQIGVRTGRLENYVTLAGTRPRRLTQSRLNLSL